MPADGRNLALFASREIRRFSFQGKVDDRLDDPRAHEKESFRRCASGLGQSLPCPASSKTGHVRYASKAVGHSELDEARSVFADVPHWT